LLHLSIGNAPASQLAAPFSFARGVYSYRIRLRPFGHAVKTSSATRTHRGTAACCSPSPS
jgi:hypothetical protein